MFDREPNIDIVFRNGLKDLEILPPGDVWESIPPVTGRRRFNTLAGIAAGLALLFTLTYLASWLTKNNDPAVQNQLAAIIEESSAVIAPDLLGSSTMSQVKPSEVFVSEVSENRTRPVEQPITSFEGPSTVSLSNNKTSVLSGEVKKEAFDDSGDILVVFPQMPVHLYNPGSQLALTDKPETKSHRLSMGASVSPAYGVTSTGNDPRLDELLSSEEVLTSYSAGLTVAYKLSSRLTFQSGIGMSSVGQHVTGVDVFAGLSDYYATKGEYLYAVQTASGTIFSTNNDIYISDSRNRVGTSTISGATDVSKYKLDHVSSDINQIFRYLEVPLVLRYKVIDRQVDLNLSGGVSYGFLVQNLAFAVDGKNTIPLGHTQGVSLHSISSQIGLGMEYNISKKFSFNVEPVFRYYLTPFSDQYNAVTRPYSIGVLSGIYFRF